MATTKTVSAAIAMTILRTSARETRRLATTRCGTWCSGGASCLPMVGPFLTGLTGVGGEAQQRIDGVERGGHPAAEVGCVRILHPGPEHLLEPADEEAADGFRRDVGDRADDVHALRGDLLAGGQE